MARESRPIKLNLGSGPREIPGYTNIDIADGHNAYPLDYPDGSVDTIRASHVLEHFSHKDVSNVILHWVDKLVPGGCLMLAVPDFKWVSDHYAAGEPINVQEIVMGQQADKYGLHRTAFDAETLAELMANAHLERLTPWISEIDDCAAQEYSCNIAGYKPTSDLRDIHGIEAVLGSARYGPAAHHQCVDEMMRAMNIRRHMIIGCFFQINISNLIEKVIADPKVEYVLCTDYDTIFRIGDVLELHRLIRTYSGVDAICPPQSKRSSKDALFCILDKNGQMKRTAWSSDFNRNLTQVQTGHFGLTLISANALRKFGKPWMVGRPNPATGSWDENSVHPDIDFWLRWRDAGNTLYLANRVRVGHLEEVVTWPGQDFSPVHQLMRDWNDTHMPPAIVESMCHTSFCARQETRGENEKCHSTECGSSKHGAGTKRAKKSRSKVARSGNG